MLKLSRAPGRPGDEAPRIVADRAAGGRVHNRSPSCEDAAPNALSRVLFPTVRGRSAPTVGSRSTDRQAQRSSDGQPRPVSATYTLETLALFRSGANCCSDLHDTSSAFLPIGAAVGRGSFSG